VDARHKAGHDEFHYRAYFVGCILTQRVGWVERSEPISDLRQRREAMDLKGVVALVTGGNGGLGQRICHALAQEGTCGCHVRSQPRPGESVASELTSRYQINAQAFACDISDGAAVDRLVGEVTQAFGRLDVLINDAAYNVSIPSAISTI